MSHLVSAYEHSSLDTLHNLRFAVVLQASLAAVFGTCLWFLLPHNDQAFWGLAIVIWPFVVLFLWLQLNEHPYPTFGLANFVTFIRAAIVVVLMTFVGGYEIDIHGWWLFTLSLISLVLDGVDGRVARYLKRVSPLGAKFDAEIDALFVMVLSVLHFQTTQVGIWVLWAGLLRYIWGVAVLIWPFLQNPAPGLMRRKVICVVTVLTMSCALCPVLSAPVVSFLCAVGVIAVSASFGLDAVWLTTHRNDTPEVIGGLASTRNY